MTVFAGKKTKSTDGKNGDFSPPPLFLLRSILPPSYLPFNDKAFGLFPWKYDSRVLSELKFW
jgi:hypothetical protein